MGVSIERFFYREKNVRAANLHRPSNRWAILRSFNVTWKPKPIAKRNPKRFQTTKTLSPKPSDRKQSNSEPPENKTCDIQLKCTVRVGLATVPVLPHLSVLKTQTITRTTANNRRIKQPKKSWRQSDKKRKWLGTFQSTLIRFPPHVCHECSGFNHMFVTSAQENDTQTTLANRSKPKPKLKPCQTCTLHPQSEANNNWIQCHQTWIIKIIMYGVTRLYGLKMMYCTKKMQTNPGSISKTIHRHIQAKRGDGKHESNRWSDVQYIFWCAPRFRYEVCLFFWAGKANVLFSSFSCRTFSDLCLFNLFYRFCVFAVGSRPSHEDTCRI